MVPKIQALKLTDVINRLETCINAILNSGDLRQWMSPDGMAFLTDTLTKIRDRKPTLERIINTPPSQLEHDFEEDLAVQIESYENLLFHLTNTLKLARTYQQEQT